MKRGKKNRFTAINSVKDVQEYLNVSKNIAYKLFNDKNFPSFSVGGSKRVAIQDLLNWIDNKKSHKERST